MPKRAVFERSRRELSLDVSVGVHIPLGCGAEDTAFGANSLVSKMLMANNGRNQNI